MISGSIRGMSAPSLSNAGPIDEAQDLIDHRVALNRIHKHDGATSMTKSGWIILLLIVPIVGLAVLAYQPISRARANARWIKAAEQLKEIWYASAAATGEFGGSYPPHVAVLLAHDYLPVNVFLDPRGFEDTVLMLGQLDVNDIGSWDPQKVDRATTTFLEQSGGFYRFGDYWFMQLRNPTDSPTIVFGWMIPHGSGASSIIFDDGHLETIGPGSWLPVLQRDAAARKRLGLPVLDPPPPLPCF